MNYAPKQARDTTNTEIPAVPAPILAKVTTSYAPPATSSVITFGANTTMIEVSALNASLALKWGCFNNNPSVIAAAGATANYDHIIPVNTTRRFVIPVSVMGSSSVVGANAANGLFTTCAVIATTSVLTAVTEF